MGSNENAVHRVECNKCGRLPGVYLSRNEKNAQIAANSHNKSRHDGVSEAYVATEYIYNQ